MQTDRLNNGRMILNYDNINVIEVVQAADRLEMYFHYRPKLKLEKLKIQREFANAQEMTTFFEKKGLFSLGDYYVNAKNISIVIDGDLNDTNKRIDVTIFFNDGAPLELNIPRDNWNTFKNYRLV
jgi:hypothetical protein